MRMFCFSELALLMEKREGLHISLFMPTHVGAKEHRQDFIRFKNLLRQAWSQLEDAGLRRPDINKMLAPAESLLADNIFWRAQRNGLALFIAPGLFLYYRVPSSLEQLLAVTERFHIKPLIPLLSSCEVFFVLALSQNKVRLLQCTADSSVEVTPEGMPQDIKEVIKEDVPGKEVLDFVVKTPSGADSILSKGPGVSPHYRKREIRKFFRRIDNSLSALLKEENSPLVLSSVKYLQPLFREVTTCSNLLPEGIWGNPDNLKEDTLREKGWAIVQPYFEKKAQDAVSQYHQYAGAGLASTQINEVLTSAFNGLVKLLFAARGIQTWGIFDTNSRTAELHQERQPGDQDLLDLASYYTLLNKGTLYVMESREIPGGANIAAVYRYQS